MYVVTFAAHVAALIGTFISTASLDGVLVNIISDTVQMGTFA